MLSYYGQTRYCWAGVSGDGIIIDMKKYVAVLGRQPFISVAELESLFSEVKFLTPELAEFEVGVHTPAKLLLLAKDGESPDIRRLGGTLKIAEEITEPLPEFLKILPAGHKITLGVSDFSHGASPFRAQGEALKLKRFLVKNGHSVRVVPNKTAVLSSATSFHNQLFRANRLEILKNGKKFYRVIGVQNIDDYAMRDRARPARDAKVGMLPPKLAQILINLCGPLPAETRLLDPFCGTGVVLQEAAIMGYTPYGTDLDARMVEYTRKNLEWLVAGRSGGLHSFARSASTTPAVAGSSRLASAEPPDDLAKSRKAPDPLASNSTFAGRHLDLAKIEVEQGDATNFQWQPPIQAVAAELFLGQPMSQVPAEIKLKQEKQYCRGVALGFLRNLAPQIEAGTPAALAMPAWLRADGHYERLNILDEIEKLGYNVKRFRNLGQGDLLYHRDGQIVAREIIVLRKI